VTRLTAAGLKPLLQWLDNEASKSLKQFIRDNNMEYQLVPPHVHRANAAEWAIRTFKNHFIAGLCSTNKLFPLTLWDQLLPQAEITLNLLRMSRINPKLSAYTQISGAFDYNAMPLAPPGTKIVIHGWEAKCPRVMGTTRTGWMVHRPSFGTLSMLLCTCQWHQCWMNRWHSRILSAAHPNAQAVISWCGYASRQWPHLTILEWIPVW
jgi:hypothetical protein